MSDIPDLEFTVNEQVSKAYVELMFTTTSDRHGQMHSDPDPEN